MFPNDNIIIIQNFSNNKLIFTKHRYNILNYKNMLNRIDLETSIPFKGSAESACLG